MASLTRAELAQYLDHTLLKPEATAAQVRALCVEAASLGVFAVCVSPSLLPVPSGVLKDSVAVAAVAGFPSGAHHAEVVADEAARAARDGATEVDMVIDLGRALSGDWAGVEKGIAAVREALPNRVLLKVILETAVLTDAQIVDACVAAEQAGAQFVKTSTGFHPAGGASTDAVALMRRTVGDRLGVKASGGIRDTAAALTMIDAGASRIGCSASAAILSGLDG